MSPRKLGIKVFATLAIILTLVFAGQILETNNEGYYQVKQAAVTGDVSVRTDAGMYPQFFGKITTYQISDMYHFSKSNLDGGEGEETDPIKVRFNDGGTALISGSIKFKLSTKDADQMLLHRDFKNYHSVKDDLVRQVVTEALMQTATLMRAEESYSTRRSEFTAMAEEQVERGIFATTSNEYKTKDAEGNEFVERIVKVKVGEDGKALVRKDSPFRTYNITILQFVIKDIDFDATIDNLIAKKKEAEQQKVVAKANAERAKQDAITAKEQGAAKIAVAKAEEEVEKIKAVTQAEKEKAVAILEAEKGFESAKLNRQRAQEDAKARLVKQRAEAQANRLLVNAGLTPQEKAEWTFKTQVGVAEKLSQVNLPGMMVIGGGNKGGQALNPFDAVGLESFMRISDKLAKPKK